MKIILCIDDNYGMMFNNRRQSRDKLLIQDVIHNTKNYKLWINSFSEPLFKDYKGLYEVNENLLECAKETEYCFIENQNLKPFLSKIDEFIIYKWNRKYPYDLQFDVSCLNEFKLMSTFDFKGNSHDKITKEMYLK